jgi:hypothetical protein
LRSSCTPAHGILRPRPVPPHRDGRTRDNDTSRIAAHPESPSSYLQRWRPRSGVRTERDACHEAIHPPAQRTPAMKR